MMPRPWAWVAVGVLSLTAPANAASVLCQRRSGLVVARDACRPSESALDPSTLGLVGPPGPAGPQGTSGPAGAPSGVVCRTTCVPGQPDVTYSCAGATHTCAIDGQEFVHATFVECASAGVLALSYCPATSCDPGLCPRTLYDTRDAAVDAHRAADGQDAYFQAHGTYATACRDLPGFASSPGAICSTAFKACAGGSFGYMVATFDRSATTCIWDSCPADGVRLQCSPPA